MTWFARRRNGLGRECGRSVDWRRYGGVCVAKSEGFVIIDGANQFQGAASLWWVVRHWPALRKEMTAARGYIAHRIWYAFPLTLGITSWWEDENAAYRFAHLPVHRIFWRWRHRLARPKAAGWQAIDTSAAARSGAMASSR